MSNPTETLYTQLMDNYGKVIERYSKEDCTVERETIALLYMEYAQAVLHFYKYSLCEDYLDKAKALLGLEFNFTGKLGVRTKYQEFKVSQLILEVEKDSKMTD